jgi:hypothetical protein
MNISWAQQVYIDSLTHWQAFVHGIHDHILALGWVQTSDTGQLNVDAATTWPGSGVFGGYILYRMNDSLAATAPVILKVGFGNAANGNYSLHMQVGFATDGARNFVGNATTEVVRNTDYDPGVYANINGDAGRLCLVIGTNATTNVASMWVVERFRDASGNNAADGVIFIGGASHDYCGTLARDGSPAVDTGNYLPAMVPRSRTSLSYGADVTVTPITPIGWRGLCMPMLSLVSYFQADLASGNNYPVSLYGVTGQYNSFTSDQFGNYANIHRIAGSAMMFKVD